MSQGQVPAKRQHPAFGYQTPENLDEETVPGDFDNVAGTSAGEEAAVDCRKEIFFWTLSTIFIYVSLIFAFVLGGGINFLDREFLEVTELNPSIGDLLSIFPKPHVQLEIRCLNSTTSNNLADRVSHCCVESFDAMQIPRDRPERNTQIGGGRPPDKVTHKSEALTPEGGGSKRRSYTFISPTTGTTVSTTEISTPTDGETPAAKQMRIKRNANTKAVAKSKAKSTPAQNQHRSHSKLELFSLLIIAHKKMK
jgi:hypothetical protein